MNSIKPLAQASERATLPGVWGVCKAHGSTHRERETCADFVGFDDSPSWPLVGDWTDADEVGACTCCADERVEPARRVLLITLGPAEIRLCHRCTAVLRRQLGGVG